MCDHGEKLAPFAVAGDLFDHRQHPLDHGLDEVVETGRNERRFARCDERDDDQQGGDDVRGDDRIRYVKAADREDPLGGNSDLRLGRPAKNEADRRSSRVRR